jgi:hypothetical protein
MATRETTETHTLLTEQRERKTDEMKKLPGSVTKHEEAQHHRRADKAAYLERKLAERERSEQKTR